MLTPFASDDTVDLALFDRNTDALLEAGVDGLILAGSLGEASTLTTEEKRLLLTRTLTRTAGRVPVILNIAEASTRAAVEQARLAESWGAHGLMLLPPMRYRSDDRETVTHFQAVAAATRLPIMIYNNPIAYGNDITPEMFSKLADVPNFVALKESSANTRRITDLHREVGGRYSIFTGVDDLALESAVLGIDGWVAGTGIAFPEENQALWEAMQAGDWDRAVTIYRWFTPLLHLDTHIKFVQYIKLAVQEVGLGKEWTRAPRLPLAGAERKRVLEIIHQGIAARPK